MTRSPAAWALTALLACWACGSGEMPGPAGPPVQTGLYILTDIGAVGAPYDYERAVYADTAIATLGFVFDSIRIVSDSTFERHFRRQVVVTRPTIPPIVESTEEFRFSGLILTRGAEIKLTVRSGLLPGGHDLAYLTPVNGGTGLTRQVTTKQYSCTGTFCEVIRQERVMASYARQ